MKTCSELLLAGPVVPLRAPVALNAPLVRPQGQLYGLLQLGQNRSRRPCVTGKNAGKNSVPNTGADSEIRIATSPTVFDVLLDHVDQSRPKLHGFHIHGWEDLHLDGRPFRVCLAGRDGFAHSQNPNNNPRGGRAATISGGLSLSATRGAGFYVKGPRHA